MAKVYLARHQAAGYLTDFVFTKPPSDKQMEAIKKLCFQRHGEKHPKTEEPYWITVEERALVGDEVPDVPDRDLSTVSSAVMPGAQVQAEGTVTPKK